jgi:hypothetical protein
MRPIVRLSWLSFLVLSIETVGFASTPTHSRAKGWPVSARAPLFAQTGSLTCTDNCFSACNGLRDRVQCEKTCVSKCGPITPPSTHKAIVKPRFAVLSVVYAPPGTGAAGAPKSVVQYSSSAQLGTSTSISSDFGSKFTLSFNVSFDSATSVGGSLGLSATVSDTDTIDLKTTTTNGVTAQTSTVDGINHDFDAVILWMNPEVECVTNGTAQATCTLTNSSGATDIQYVYIAWLKNPSTIPAGLLAKFKAIGINASDYAQMMLADPFTNGPAPIDPNRFQEISMTVPYEPAPQGVVAPSFPYSISKSLTQTSQKKAVSEISAGVSVSAGVDLGIYSAKVGVSDTWTWTNTTSTTQSQQNTQNATLTLTSPSSAWTGATDIAVYWDSIYGSYLFDYAGPTGTESVAGVVRTAKAVSANTLVSLTKNGKVHRTYTDSAGRYRFYGISGKCQLSVGGKTQTVTVGRKGLKHDVALR